MTGAVHETVVKYRECARGIWNTCFRHDADWDTVDDFRELDSRLFDLMVLRPLGLSRGEGQGTTAELLDVQIAEPVALIMVRQQPSSERNASWDLGPQIHPGDAVLKFIRFFDWYELGVRDFAYVRVRIVEWRNYPELASREALLEMRYAEIVVARR
jgi:hypothetical protein